MFKIYFHIKFHMSRSDSSLYITINPQTIVTMLSHYTLLLVQKITIPKIAYFSSSIAVQYSRTINYCAGDSPISQVSVSKKSSEDT
jgi:hypothetical protein